MGTLRLLTLIMGLTGFPVQAHVWEDCHQDGIRATVQCASIRVPENPATADGPGLDLHLVKIPAISTTSAAEPLLFLAGGPGQAATELSAIVAQRFRQVREQRDIILVDQRGTGQSNPLQCDFSVFTDWLLPDEELDLTQAAAHCAEELDADLQQYHTHAAIADLEVVRQQLELPAWHIYGGSYGTRVALEYARLHAPVIRSMTLDGVVPGAEVIGLFGAEATAALEHMWRDCMVSQACASRFPGLPKQYRQLLSELQQEPVALKLPDGRSGEPTSFLLTAKRFQGMVRNALYTPHSRQLLPYVITAVAGGDYTPIAGLLNSFDAESPLYFGLLLSVLCQEDQPRATSEQLASEEQYALIGGELSQDFQRLCAGWPVQPAEHKDELAVPVETAVPTLLLSGGQDPVTPPAWAEQVAEHLPKSQHLVAPHGGHTIMTHTCANRLVADFLLDPGAEIPDQCLRQHPQLPFILNRNAAGM